MNYWRFYTLLFIVFFVLSLNSCENTFEVVDDWKNIPIVYGLLNEGDTAQYIRVEKAFLDPEVSALILAQEADSLYYENADVRLVALDAGVPGEIITMTQVDANNEGYPKIEGIFATTPNFVYKTLEPINSSSIYRLEVSTAEGDVFVTAETAVIPDYDVFTPQAGNFIDFNPEEDTDIVWEVLPQAKFFEITMILEYRDFPTGSPWLSENHVLEWKIATKVKPDGIAGRVEVDGERFYSFIAANVPEIPGMCRITGEVTMYIDAGGEELLRHIEVFEANQSGVTGSEPFPEYTNLSEGRGIFSTRYRKTLASMNLSLSTREELAAGPITGHLGFTSEAFPCN
ncbi:MAG: hypothetical protein AAF502_18670 [Bacteroidota bacterium]